MRKFLWVVIICITLFSKPFPIHAVTDYVLPYPSFMPGSKFYTIHLLWENAMKYWYFGSFSQFHYNLSLSDKYLIEAKTLFEYRQYFFAYQALKKSNNYFMAVQQSLTNAQKENKNLDQKLVIFKSAARKHIEILENVKKTVPEEFVWQEEKKDQVILHLRQIIESSIYIRE